MVRQYAAEFLQASGEREAVYARHRDWCIAVVAEARNQLEGGEQEAALLRFETERDNLRASLQWDGPVRELQRNRIATCNSPVEFLEYTR